ncbi:MAG: nucleotide exchange factor GrpE [bacterium]|nr:nucleotide exchange factor GrpE [bacterium]
MKKENDKEKNIDVPADSSDNDDVSFEMEDDAARPEEKLKALREKFKVCDKEKREYLAGWQRAKADFINFKKETEAGKREWQKHANERMIGELLPVLDSFREASRNREAWERVDKNWRTGVEYIHGQLMEVLARHGVAVFGKEGEDFSPERHVAAEAVETAETAQDGKIAEVVQEGVSAGGKVLRPARVKIFKSK